MTTIVAGVAAYDALPVATLPNTRRGEVKTNSALHHDEVMPRPVGQYLGGDRITGWALRHRIKDHWLPG